MARLKKALKKAVSVGKAVFKSTPVGAGVSAVTKKKKTTKKRTTLASVKKKIALLKAKKELSKVRGY